MYNPLPAHILSGEKKLLIARADVMIFLVLKDNAIKKNALASKSY